jgi:hypothetical protein
MRGFVSVACAVVVFAVLSVASASASGPAAPGKDIIQLDCAGLGHVTVSVQRGQNSNGAGQIVGAQGLGIPVSITFTVTDLTKNAVVFSDTSASGNGNGHPNQATILCTGTQFQGSASDFFAGGPLPAGVAATDTIRASLTANVILKP